MKKVLCILAVFTFLLGCNGQLPKNNANDAPQKIEQTTVIYDCQGEQIQAVFKNDEVLPVVQLTFIGRENMAIILTNSRSASGAKYSNGNTMFWTHQGEAMLSMEDTGQNLKCRTADTGRATTKSELVDANGNSIDPRCKAWFDGCNICQVLKGGLQVACTRKYCPPEAIQPPRCLDGETNSQVRKNGG